MKLSETKTFERYDWNAKVYDHTLVSSEPPIIAGGLWCSNTDLIDQPVYHATADDGSIHRFDSQRTFEIYQSIA